MCARRGKRKRAKPPAKKAKPKVSTVFDCPFCGKTEACGVSMDHDHKVGAILCDSCGAKYETRINRLTDPIDVYAEWIDKCVLQALTGSKKSVIDMSALLRAGARQSTMAKFLGRRPGCETMTTVRGRTMMTMTTIEPQPFLRD